MCISYLLLFDYIYNENLRALVVKKRKKKKKFVNYERYEDVGASYWLVVCLGWSFSLSLVMISEVSAVL